MDAISDKLSAILSQIAQAETELKRQKGTVRLIAVSKTFGADDVHAALKAGQRAFGENYVQEAKDKWPALREAFADVELHMIGPLQSNKAKDAVGLFDVIQTLDRESLAKELAKEMDKQGRRPKLLLQVNTGEESQKGGVAPKAVPDFLETCRRIYGLEIAGLMCIPPFDQPPAPHFGLLKQMASDLGLAELSMGMSSDFISAIGLGATYVRVGTAIFGGRSYAAP